MEYTNADNYEHIKFDDTGFPFNCFLINGTDTLPHWHNHFEMVFPRKGSCTVYINGTSYTVSHRELILVPPGSLHSIFPRDGSAYCAVVAGESLFGGLNSDRHFSQVFLPFMSIGLYPPIILSEKDNTYKRCFELVDQLYLEYLEKQQGYQARIKSLLVLFFSYLNTSLPDNFFDDNKISSSENIIKNSLDYLNLHYEERITVNRMSEYCHLSVQHFSRLFKAYTGKTFVEYLTLLRLEHARKLLKGTDIPIIQIPDLVGFCNGNYFSRLYKRHYGCPPSRDRSQ